MHERNRKSICRFRYSLDLPIASFFHAGTEVAGLRALFDDERSTALRARFIERLVRRSVITIRISAAAVKNPTPPTPFGRATANEFTFSAFRAFDSQGDGPGVLALGIIFATDEITEAALGAKGLAFVGGAFFVQLYVRLARGPCAAHQTASGLAIRIAGTRKEHAKAAALDGHFLTAVIAIFDFHFAVVRGELGRKILYEIAIGIAIAAQEKTVAADALEQFSLAALLAFLPGRNARLIREHFVFGLIQVQKERIPEFPHRLTPRQFAILYFVEFFFEAGSEAHVENILETSHQQHADALAEHRRREAALVFCDVLSIDDRRDDRRVSRRPANAFFFEFFYQSRFRVPRRRLGEMLLRANGFKAKLIAFADGRQAVPGCVAFVVLFFFFLHGLIGGQVAIEFLDRTAGPEGVIVCVHVDRGLVKNRGNHLRSDKALPNHLEQLEHGLVEIRFYALRGTSYVRGTDCFVSFLRVFLRLKEVRLFRKIVLTVT